MAKQPINEGMGIVERLLSAIFMSVVKKKSEVIKKKFGNDPKVQFHIKQLESSRAFLEKYLEDRRTTDPDWAETEKTMNGVMDRP